MMGSPAGSPKALGRYELACELSQSYLGSFWAVRVASGEGQGLDAAARCIIPGQMADQMVFDRLCEAAWTAMEITSPHVPTVVDVVLQGSEIGVISDYCEGLGLRALVRQATLKRVQVPVGVAVRLGLDLLEALNDVHAQAENLGELGADLFGGITPDSVLVGVDGEAHLLDALLAGVAATLVSFRNHPERASYLTPEQVREMPVDARTDLFSVGVLLWEALAGRRLFFGIGGSVAQKILSQPIQSLDEIERPGESPLPAELSAIVDRALDRNPAKRFGTAREMIEALHSARVPIAERRLVADFLEQIGEHELGRLRRGLDRPPRNEPLSARFRSSRPAPPREAEDAIYKPLSSLIPAIRKGTKRPPQSGAEATAAQAARAQEAPPATPRPAPAPQPQAAKSEPKAAKSEPKAAKSEPRAAPGPPSQVDKAEARERPAPARAPLPSSADAKDKRTQERATTAQADAEPTKGPQAPPPARPARAPQPSSTEAKEKPAKEPSAQRAAAATDKTAPAGAGRPAARPRAGAQPAAPEPAEDTPAPAAARPAAPARPLGTSEAKPPIKPAPAAPKVAAEPDTDEPTVQLPPGAGPGKTAQRAPGAAPQRGQPKAPPAAAAAEPSAPDTDEPTVQMPPAHPPPKTLPRARSPAEESRPAQPAKAPAPPPREPPPLPTAGRAAPRPGSQPDLSRALKNLEDLDDAFEVASTALESVPPSGEVISTTSPELIDSLPAPPTKAAARLSTAEVFDSLPPAVATKLEPAPAPVSKIEPAQPAPVPSLDSGWPVPPEPAEDEPTTLWRPQENDAARSAVVVTAEPVRVRGQTASFEARAETPLKSRQKTMLGLSPLAKSPPFEAEEHRPTLLGVPPPATMPVSPQKSPAEIGAAARKQRGVVAPPPSAPGDEEKPSRDPLPAEAAAEEAVSKSPEAPAVEPTERLGTPAETARVSPQPAVVPAEVPIREPERARVDSSGGRASSASTPAEERGSIALLLEDELRVKPPAPDTNLASIGPGAPGSPSLAPPLIHDPRLADMALKAPKAKAQFRRGLFLGLALAVVGTAAAGIVVWLLLRGQLDALREQSTVEHAHASTTAPALVSASPATSTPAVPSAATPAELATPSAAAPSSAAAPPEPAPSAPPVAEHAPAPSPVGRPATVARPRPKRRPSYVPDAI